nr:DUF3077 domain-containing protein [Pseudomonas sp.]
MNKTDSPAPSELKTIGFTPLIFCSNQALLNVRAGVPISDALAHGDRLGLRRNPKNTGSSSL